MLTTWLVSSTFNLSQGKTATLQNGVTISHPKAASSAQKYQADLKDACEKKGDI